MAFYQLTVHSVPYSQRSLTILEGFGDVFVTEASQTERPRHFTVLLGDGFAGREKRAERVETNEEVLFGHYVIGVG
jgi:glycerol-3-phosphate dehydrogenase